MNCRINTVVYKKHIHIIYICNIHTHICVWGVCMYVLKKITVGEIEISKSPKVNASNK